MTSEFYDHTDFPEVLSGSNKNCSIDVLVYSPKSDEHTIGWFDFQVMTWRFLCREAVEKFVWRYLDEQIDKP